MSFSKKENCPACRQNVRKHSMNNKYLCSNCGYCLGVSKKYLASIK